MEAEPLSIFGTHKREIEKEVSKKVDAYGNMLMQSALDCEDEGVTYTLNPLTVMQSTVN